MNWLDLLVPRDAGELWTAAAAVATVTAVWFAYLAARSAAVALHLELTPEVVAHQLVQGALRGPTRLIGGWGARHAVRGRKARARRSKAAMSASCEGNGGPRSQKRQPSAR